MNRLAILLGGAIALAGCASQPAAPPPAAMVDPNNPLFAPGYLAMAASSDLFEIRSAELAHPRALSPSVHSFATMLQNDHARTTQLLMDAARAAGLTPPQPVLLPQHQAMLDQLSAAGSGFAFDQLFKQIQIQAHSEALQLHQNYAAQGDLPALRTVASGAVPVIQMHLQQAQALQIMPPPVAVPTTGRAGERG